MCSTPYPPSHNTSVVGLLGLPGRQDCSCCSTGSKTVLCCWHWRHGQRLWCREHSEHFHRVCFGTLGVLGRTSSPPHMAVPLTIHLAFRFVAAFAQAPNAWGRSTRSDWDTGTILTAGGFRSAASAIVAHFLVSSACLPPWGPHLCWAFSIITFQISTKKSLFNQMK